MVVQQFRLHNHIMVISGKKHLVVNEGESFIL